VLENYNNNDQQFNRHDFIAQIYTVLSDDTWINRKIERTKQIHVHNTGL